MRASRIGGVWWGVGAWLVAVGYVASMIHRGWVPIDEGTLGLSARYAAAGYLPHRDFAYPYTGGLAWLNAAVLEFAGASLAAPRWVLLAVCAAWLHGIWRLSRRFVAAPLAAALLVLAAWWSVLIYPAATPGYYVLFATTWATLALFRWSDTGADRWLWIAGGLCGLAILVKQTGAYALVGSGLGVVAIVSMATLPPTPRRDDHAGATAPAVGRHRWLMLATVLAALAMAMLVPLALVCSRGIASGETLLLAAPLAAVLGVLAVRTVRARPGAPYAIVRAWAILDAATAIVLAPLVLWYAAHGALGALLGGAVAGATATAATIGMSMPAIAVDVGYAAPVVLVAWLCGLPPSRAVRWFVGGVVAAGAVVAAAMAVAPYLAVWTTAELTVPAGVLATVVAVRRAGPDDRRAALLLVMAAALAMRALDQYPYAAPNYFAYVAPLAFVLLASSMTMLVGPPLPEGAGAAPGAAAQGRSARWRPGAVVASPFLVALALLFGGWFHRIGNVGSVGWQPVWTDDRHPLPGPYGGLEVTPRDSATYARLLALVDEHGGPEAFIAGPELPALYVLVGTTRLVAQPYLLVPDRYADSTAMAAAVDTSRVRAVAVNHAPMFLPRVKPDARDWLARHYPMVEHVGDVEFRWR